jgi:hypothetical protein
MKKTLFAVAPCLLLALSGFVRAEDAAAPAGARWTLKFEHGPLRIVPVREGANRYVSYHYIRLKVTNPTSLARPWNPLVEAITDTKQVRRAVGYGNALAAIRAQERAPAIPCCETTSGKIQPNETKDVVAVFGPLDPNYDRVEVRIHGLVNPITVYKVEKYGEAEDNSDEVVVDAAYSKHNAEVLARARAAGNAAEPKVEYREVRETRVWSIQFSRPGDEFGREADLIRMITEGWKVIPDPKTGRLHETLRVMARPGAPAPAEGS